jgi:hypothetical protein
MFVPKKMARAKGTGLISTPKKKTGSIADPASPKQLSHNPAQPLNLRFLRKSAA